MIVPVLGKKSILQQRKMQLHSKIDDNHIPADTSPKICSTMICPRCEREQDRWRATCMYCRACFYCGLVGGGEFFCHICNNSIPEEDRIPYEPKTIRIV